MKLFGIKNCDTVRKARRWLDVHQLAYDFHDFKSQGLDEVTLTSWLAFTDWQTLLNKRGTTWRQLEDPRKDQLNQTLAIELMLAHPTLIKRPVLQVDNRGLVGFDEQQYRDFNEQ